MNPQQRQLPLPALVLILFLLQAASVQAAGNRELPRLTLSVLQFGTAHWELEHIRRRHLDLEAGYRLLLNPVANLPASHLAVTGGSVDGAVADLIWAQSRYQSGTPYLYVPFSAQIGDIVVADDSPVRQVSDLAGLRIGVAGGPDSKGWVLLQKVAARQGLNLTRDSEVQYAAPPLLSQALKRGQLDAIVTYWHFAARLRGEGGWRSAFGMADLLAELGLERNLPVLGYVFPRNWAREHGDLVDNFAVSLALAREQLARQPDYWKPLRPLMRNPDDGVFAALQQGFIAGDPEPLTAARIADLKQLLVLTGAPVDRLMPDELFWRSSQ